MTREEANDRMILSRCVLAGWERAVPVGSPEDLLRLIGEEIAVLERILVAHPQKAAAVSGVIERYRTLGDRVKAKAN